jgi:hypothetical protein
MSRRTFVVLLYGKKRFTKVAESQEMKIRILEQGRVHEEGNYL